MNMNTITMSNVQHFMQKLRLVKKVNGFFF